MNKILSLLGLARRAGKPVLGFTATCAAMEKGRIKLVIMAEDTAANTRKKMEKNCRRHGVVFHYFANREELGCAIGKKSQVVLGLPAHGLTDLIAELFASRDAHRAPCVSDKE